MTAIFAVSDAMAYGAIRGLQKKGVSIPKEIAVVGMDDLDMSNWITPSLTTVRYDIESMGSLAAKFIVNRIQSPVVKAKDMGEVVETPTYYSGIMRWPNVTYYSYYQ